MTVEIKGGITVRSNTRGPEDPIASWPMTVQVHEIESSISCGFRAEWGTVDVDGEPLVAYSGAGWGSPWMTISFRGKQYAIGVHEMVDVFLQAISATGDSVASEGAS